VKDIIEIEQLLYIA